MDTRNKKSHFGGFWAEATNPANLLQNLVACVVGALLLTGFSIWIGLNPQKWWLPTGIGFVLLVVFMIIGLVYRRRKRHVSSHELDPSLSANNLSQSVYVGGNQSAPNINAPHGHVTVIHDHGAAALQDAVSKGDAGEILEAFQRQQVALKSFDPWWALEAHLLDDGGGALGLKPRVPEAYDKNPINIHFASQVTPEFPDLASLLRHVYVTGHPVTVSARDIHVSVGPKRFVSMETGVVTLGIPEDAIEHSVIKLLVPEVGVSYDYIELAIRTYDGVRYMDNKGQEHYPLLVSGEAEVNSDGKTMRFSLEMGLSPQGSKSAKQFVRFLTMLCALAEGHQLHLVNLVTEKDGIVDEGELVRAEELPALTAQVKWWSKVVDLERQLSLTFDIPEQISEEDYEAVEHLWAVLVQRKAEHEMPPMTFSVSTGIDTARQIVSAMTDKGFAVGGECESEDVSVLGTTLRLPERRVMMYPVHLDNPEVFNQAGEDSADLVTLRFSANQPVTVTEEPLA